MGENCDTACSEAQGGLKQAGKRKALRRVKKNEQVNRN